LALFDSLAARYDAWFDADGKEIFALEAAAFRFLLPLLPKPWLEVGVGSGRFAQALGIPWGVDPSERLLELARRRGIRAFRGTAEELPIPDGLVGTVFLIVTLCFVNDVQRTLAEAGRVLRSDGCLVAGVVPSESPWGRFYRNKAKQDHPFYSHARFFEFDELEGLISDAGFETKRVVSTLLSAPDEPLSQEITEGRRPDAGFVVVRAEKKRKEQ